MKYSKPIAVGVDGTSASTEAVRWAAHNAQLHDVPLVLVAAAEPVAPALAAYAVPEVYYDAGREYCEHILDQADSVVRETDSADIEVRTRLVEGGARSALLSASDRASLLVVGAPSSGRLASGLLGSVTSAVATHARCPVVVIREHVSRPRVGLVTVGVDGSPLSLKALEIAADEAASREATLDIVYAWDARGLDSSDERYAQARQAVQSRLDDIVASLISTTIAAPRVTSRLVEDSPESALGKASGDCDLLVVGSRGRGGFTGMLLGSTSQSLLYSAQCPLMIVRDKYTDD